MSDLDLDAIESKWLQQCGPCDGGLPMSCSHPAEDYRPVMAALVDAIREPTCPDCAALQARLRTLDAKLAAARLALAACAEVREAKSATPRLGSCCVKVGTEECVCENPTNWGLDS